MYLHVAAAMGRDIFYLRSLRTRPAMWIACHTRTTVAGMSSDAASGSASATAFINTASEAGGRSRLVDTFDAEHIAAARHRVERAAERRQIIGAGHRVIHERAGEELSA